MEENPPPTTPTPLPSGPSGIRGFLARFDWRIWKRVFITFLLLTLVIIAVGSTMTLSGQQINEIQQNLERMLPKSPDALFIFRNNFSIASLMLVPGLGVAAGLFILFDTGLAITTLATPTNIPGILIFLGLLILPFSWLEFFAYSSAMTQSVLLTLALVRRRGVKKELIRTGIVWAGMFVVLLAAALIEALFIRPA
ncbi:MAG: stage II sporulation protein M [Thaumarchaeota archaeon]|nr:stage II sporulation protein M [Nitrososphaerota archaeon]MCL5316985.1 stage II sporulation protein M [Nitrososphaerota archaeon]